MRWRRVAVLILPAIAFTALFFRFLFPPHSIPLSLTETLEKQIEEWRPAPPPKGRAKLADSRSHPIAQLVQEASNRFEQLKSSQSRSLAAAVGEYKRRYKLQPPPHFDKWYEFARASGVKIIDDYDTIHESLLPFWALPPKTLRSRVAEAIGYEDNAFIAVMIRDGHVVQIEGGTKEYRWQKGVTKEMLERFSKYLPDMDIAFNIHDEPRIVVPHDELALMVHRAQRQVLPVALAAEHPVNSFSARPLDMSDGERIEEKKTTRFNEYAQQSTWVTSRMSCPLDSPARSIEDEASDIMTGYAFGELGFIRNQSAYSDICMSPSLRNSFGFFDRPNAFKVSHELIPVFSQSKVSSYQDILYPSPWYVYGKTVTGQHPSKHKPQYDESRELRWDKKTDVLWWRGSTTGGFSRAGSWRRQHRQRFVRKMNAPERAKIMLNHAAVTLSPSSFADEDDSDNDNNRQDWQVAEVARRDLSSLIDIKFSHVGQCDAGDCEAQKEFFEMADKVDSQEAWKYKFLLDMDGNAFSGRFYAFLKSGSLPFKASIFREWHQEWLVPWVHYVPVSFRADDTLEAVRYFAEDEQEGRRLAQRLAIQGRDWAGQALRNVDLEAWFFRLLLEYARILDDDRLSIAYSP